MRRYCACAEYLNLFSRNLLVRLGSNLLCGMSGCLHTKSKDYTAHVTTAHALCNNANYTETILPIGLIFILSPLPRSPTSHRQACTLRRAAGTRPRPKAEVVVVCGRGKNRPHDPVDVSRQFFQGV